MTTCSTFTGELSNGEFYTGIYDTNLQQALCEVGGKFKQGKTVHNMDSNSIDGKTI